MEKKNIKQIIIGVGIFVLAITSTIISFSNLSDTAKVSDESSSWMKNISDDEYISNISIPGTHDSGALYSIADVAGKCQDLSIKKQLESGARFLDIRLIYTNSGFKVIHGMVDERQDFSNVLKVCKEFLSKNNSETIIMSIKKEADGKDGFSAALEKLIADNGDLFYTARSIPQLKDVRGKIILFSRYSENNLGLDASHNWLSPSKESVTNTFEIVNGEEKIHVQDYFEFSNLEDKWNEVTNCLSYTSSKTDAKILSINFLSGVQDGGFPPSYSVPVAKYINTKFISYKDSFTKSGTVLFDFITEEMAKIVYSKNF
ncbi:MAG: phosphatidylinositol-specific phospholipase C [Bacilli bacterium]|nr:phosphatidylinositol-specific phospholipase C [Bacilli bacterium]